jgi:hypothetical protein
MTIHSLSKLLASCLGNLALMASIFKIISFNQWLSFVSVKEACETRPHESGIRINLSTVQFQCYLIGACVRAQGELRLLSYLDKKHLKNADGINGAAGLASHQAHITPTEIASPPHSWHS